MSTSATAARPAIVEEASRCTVGAGAPIVLTGPNWIWQVSAGEVEVYGVALENGHPIDNRVFIRKAAVGDFVFAAPLTEGNLSWQLIVATGERAELLPIEDESLVVLARAPDSGGATLGAVAAWLEDFGAAVGGTAAPLPEQTRILATTVGEETVDEGIAIRAGSGTVVWVKLLRGSLAFFGEHQLAVSGGGMPLTSLSWATAVGGEAVVRGLALSEAAEHADWPDMLVLYHCMMMLGMATSLKRRHEQLEARIARSRQGGETAFDASMERLAGVLNRSDPVDDNVARESPLLAAARMVAAVAGIEVPPGLMIAGRTAAQMLETLGHRLRSPIREVTLRGEWWRQDLGPLLGFTIEGGKPVALLPEGSHRYRLVDPQSERSSLIGEREAAGVAAKAFVFYSALPERPLSLQDLLTFGLKRCRPDVLTVVGAAALGAICNLAIPLAMGALIDELIPSHLPGDVIKLGILLVVIASAQLCFRVTGQLALLRVEGRLANRLQSALVDRTIRLPSAFLNRFSSGDLLFRSLSVDLIRRQVTGTIVDSLLSGVLSVFSFAVLVIYAPAVAILAFVLLLLLVILTFWSGISRLDALQASEVKSVRASSFGFQLVNNITHLRAAGAEERAFARWAHDYAEARQLLMRAKRSGNLFAAFLAAYEIVSLALIFIAIARFAHGISTGGFLAFISAYSALLASSVEMSAGILQVFSVVPRYRRAQPLLAAVPEVTGNKADPGALVGNIEVTHLSFSYAENLPTVLNDISLTVRAGEFVALVGPSGCGKSTLMKLLIGFETPSAGSIYYEGQDLRNLDAQAVRRQIGIVLQQGRLLPATIAENILTVYDGTLDDAWAAARMAGLAEDIERMPMGMHTMLTDAASALSGGQVQRLLIARALVGRPRILLLDEATSALDNRTQSIVTRSLEQLAVTRLVIAHRLSTIERADRIYVFDAGRIVQTGTFRDLASIQGPFAELVRRQLGKSENSEC